MAGATTSNPSEKDSDTKPTEYRYDVFISYSSHDKTWVRGELLTRIEQAGLKAFIDHRDFTRGAPSIKEMERGVVTCRKTLLILTPNYVDSEWCEIENIMTQTLSPANRDLRLIPLLKADCKKPLRIGALTYIDFTDGADHDLAWRQLLTALGAPPDAEPAKEPEHEDWFLAHPYPMPPNFTGRVAESEMLSQWLNTDADHPLLSLRALGGFGKSALAWHWLTHDVAHTAWPRVVWWSFYEDDASFDNFLTETLNYLDKGKNQPDKPSGKNAVKRLLELLHAPGTLLVLDGFERALRAFGGLDAAYKGDEPGTVNHNDRDCISPLAEKLLYDIALHPRLQSKVLLTTRLCPRVLEAKGGGLLQGCREEELDQMQPADAVAFFHAQGIRGTHTEIEHACAPYGYHPLSLGILAGWIVKDLQQPGDIAAANRLDVSGDLKQRQHHVLEVAYDSLTPERKKLLSRIACFRGPVKYEALKALAGSEFNAETQRRGEDAKEEESLRLRASALNLDSDLHDLVARGLLHHDRNEGRFDLHPIVRRYAYDRLATPDRTVAHTHLRDYFAAVPTPDKVTRLEDLAPVIERYHHTVRAGQFDEACDLLYSRLAEVLHFQLGAYQLRMDLLRQLFPDGEDRPPRLKKESAQAWALNALAISYSTNGQPLLATPLFEVSNEFETKRGAKRALAIGLGNMATQRLAIGALRTCDVDLRRRIALCREIMDELNEAAGHQELGWLLAYRGAYGESGTELMTALKISEKHKHTQGQGIVWACRALRELLLLRSGSDPALGIPHSALESARRALELADETARTRYPHERDYVRAHWVLGAAYRVAGEHVEAERHLHEALERCRRINCVDHEADILIDLARLRSATGAPEAAQRLAEDVLVITERSGYVLQGADAHLKLAKLARARRDVSAARDHAQQAKDLATCDGPPDYTYKVAYDEALALLAELGDNT